METAPRHHCRATVLFPTFGGARFARWPLESIRRQTVDDLEIFVICDGSPPDMVAFFEELARRDPRISVFTFPKSPRTGEPHRDGLIRERARGHNIYYCCHDDLWFPDHIEVLERQLEISAFAHSIHVGVAVGQTDPTAEAFLENLGGCDLSNELYREKMLDESTPTNYIGLTCAAHTAEAYLNLDEGWVTAPDGVWTDHHMWRKFLRQFPSSCATVRRATSMHFRVGGRPDFTEGDRARELEDMDRRLLDPAFVDQVRRAIAVRLR